MEDYLAGYRQCADGCHHRTGNHQLHGPRTGDFLVKKLRS